MNPLTRLRTLMGGLDLESPRQNTLRVLWDRLQPLPGGSRLFSLAVGRAARYTGTIHAHVLELRPGYSRVQMADTPRVRNHLRSVHAVAMVNLAELAGNVALAYSMPEDARFIVSGLSIEYLKKARGTLTAEGRPPDIHSSARQEYDVPVTLTDSASEVVARATLKTLVGPKKPAAERLRDSRERSHSRPAAHAAVWALLPSFERCYGLGCHAQAPW